MREHYERGKAGRDTEGSFRDIMVTDLVGREELLRFFESAFTGTALTKLKKKCNIRNPVSLIRIIQAFFLTYKTTSVSL